MNINFGISATKLSTHINILLHNNLQFLICNDSNEGFILKSMKNINKLPVESKLITYKSRYFNCSIKWYNHRDQYANNFNIVFRKGSFCLIIYNIEIRFHIFFNESLDHVKF